MRVSSSVDSQGAMVLRQCLAMLGLSIGHQAQASILNGPAGL